MFSSARTIPALVLLAGLAVAAHALSQSDTGPDKVARILMAEDARCVTDDLARLTHDPDPAVAARAIRAIGRIGDPAGLPALLDALKFQGPGLKEEAIFAIGELEDAEALSLVGAKPDARAATALLAFLVEPVEVLSQDVLFRRALAIEALGKVRDAGSVQEIMKAGRMCLGGVSGSVPEQISLKAIMALVRIGDRAAAPFLVEALEAASPEVRRSAALGLGRLKYVESAPKLLELFEDPAAEVRSAAAWALVKMDAEEYAPKALPLLNDPAMEVRIEAIRLLALGEGPEMTDALFHHIRRGGGRLPINFNNEDLEAVAAIGRIGGKDAVDFLEQLLNNQGAAGLAVRSAYATCPTVDDKKLLAVDRRAYAYSALSYTSWAYALVERKGGGSKTALGLIVEDPAAPPEAKAVALVSLAEAGLPEVEGWAIQELNNPGSDSILRAAAAEALGLLRTDSALDALLKAWPRSHRNADPDVRLSILDALGRHAQILDEGSISRSKIRVAILSGTKDRDRLIRARSIRLLADVFQEDHLDLLGAGGEPKPYEHYLAAAELIGTRPLMKIETPKGIILIEMDPDAAPLTVLQFKELADNHAFDKLTFHRVVPDFVVQGGDPRGTGWGSAGPYLPCEISRGSFVVGSVGMATAGKDTGSSQFFIALSSQPHLDGSYTLFGRVVEGMDVARRLKPGDPIVRLAVAVPKGDQP